MAPPSRFPQRHRGAIATWWHLANFKAIECADVELRRLTLLAGSNSSGKSSLLQSLLFLAQSVDVESVVLNGSLVRLGEATDVVRLSQLTVSIGTTLNERGDRENEESFPASGGFSADVRVDLARRGTELVPVAIAVRDSIGQVRIEAVRHPRWDKALQAAGVLEADGQCLRVSTVDGRQSPSPMFIGMAGLLPDAVIYRRTLKQTQPGFAVW